MCLPLSPGLAADAVAHDLNRKKQNDMTTVKNLDEMVSRLRADRVCRRVAVVCPRDKSTLAAVERAAGAGFVEPIVIDHADPQRAAEEAVELAQRGEVDMLMKGLLPSEKLLRAILRHNGGLLPEGHVLTHTACAEIPAYGKLLFYTDAAVLPFPSHEQRVQQVRYMAALCRAMGVPEPRISLVHCSEEVDTRHFPYTGGYPDIAEMARRGDFGPCVVDGPLDLKTSLSAESMRVKGIDSPLGGEADALVFPDIEAANVFHKTITLFCGARPASLLQGPRVPVVLPSRADGPDTKFYSLALAAALGAST